MGKKIKGVKSFSFLKTTHSQPLSKEGRDNWDRIFNKNHQKETKDTVTHQER